MATQTTHYNLKKPDDADYYDIADFNQNMDTIDQSLYGLGIAQGNIGDKIGMPTDTSNQTVMGKLNKLVESKGFCTASDTVQETILSKQVGWENKMVPASHYTYYTLFACRSVIAQKTGTMRVKANHFTYTATGSPLTASTWITGCIYVFPDDIAAYGGSSNYGGGYRLMTQPKIEHPFSLPEGSIVHDNTVSDTGFSDKFLVAQQAVSIPPDQATFSGTFSLEKDIFVKENCPLCFYVGFSTRKEGASNITFSCDNVTLCYDNQS